MIITKQYLDDNPDHLFVFGDNLMGKGYGGAAALRDHPQSIGFVTKKLPDNEDSSFYRPNEYAERFTKEMELLEEQIKALPNRTFLISQLGSGLADRYNIWSLVIKPRIEWLKQYSNVKFLWED